MADFSSFSSSSFTSSDWINNAVKEKNDEESLESYLAQLAMKLHIISQDYTDQLETAMVESMSIMPRLQAEINRIEDSLKEVKSEMNVLSVQLKDFDEKNVSGSEELSRLDTLKSNMEGCTSILLEHNRWNFIVNEAKNFMESGGKLSESADRIETLHKSLEILQYLPGHDERKQTCDGLSESLISALQSRVYADITGNDISLIQDYLYVYERLGRKGHLESEYSKFRPKIMSTTLDQIHSAHSISDSLIWLNQIFLTFKSFMNEELMNTEVLFGQDHSKKILCDMLQMLFQFIHSQLSDRLVQISSSVNIQLTLDMFQLVDTYLRDFTCLLFKENNVSSAGSSSIMTSQSAQSETVQLVDREKLLETYQIALKSFYDHAMSNYPDNEIHFLKIELMKHYHILNQIEAQDNEFDGDKGSAADSGSGLMNPDESLTIFGQKLMQSATQLQKPIRLIIDHSVSYFSGLSLKPTLRQLSFILNSYIKFMCHKIDEIRLGYGLHTNQFQTKTADIQADSVIALQFQEDAGVSKNIISSYQKQIEIYGFNDKDWIAPAILILLSAGQLSVVIKELDFLTMGLCNTLLSQLISRDVKTMFNQLLNIGVKSSIKTSQESNNQKTSIATAADGKELKISQIFVHSLLQNNFDQFSQMKSFLSLYSLPSSTAAASASVRHQNSQTLLYTTTVSLTKYRFLCGSFLFELCSSSIEKMLLNYSVDDVSSWAGAPTGNRTTAAETESDEPLSLENFLPQSLITQVGEHMLSLFQEFESFPASEHTAEMKSLLGEATSLTLASNGWIKLKQILNLNKEDETVESLCKRATSPAIISSLEVTLFGAPISIVHSDYVHLQQQAMTTETVSNDENNNDSTDAVVDDSSNTETNANSDKTNSVERASPRVEEVLDVGSQFVNEWLGAIVDSILGYFLAGVLQLSHLSRSGAAQLCVDIDYLSNVLNAMGLRQHPLINHIRQLLERSLVNLRAGVHISSISVRSPALNTLHKIYVIIVNLLETSQAKK